MRCTTGRWSSVSVLRGEARASNFLSGHWRPVIRSTVASNWFKTVFFRQFASILEPVRYDWFILWVDRNLLCGNNVRTYLKYIVHEQDVGGKGCVVYCFTLSYICQKLYLLLVAIIPEVFVLCFWQSCWRKSVGTGAVGTVNTTVILWPLFLSRAQCFSKSKNSFNIYRCLYLATCFRWPSSGFFWKIKTI